MQIFALIFIFRTGVNMTLRFLTAGESHGPALVGILDGMPAGVKITAEDFDVLMKKRQSGYGRGERSQKNIDKCEVLAGVEFGQTTGNPIALLLKNGIYTEVASPVLTVPIPGHADFAGAMKYGNANFRSVRERASARETAMRVALSVFPRNLLRMMGISSTAFVKEIGGINARIDFACNPEDLAELVNSSPAGFMTPDHSACLSWKEMIDSHRAEGKSLGGSGCVIFSGLPAGLGGLSQSDCRLDGQIASQIMSLPAVKAVSICLNPDEISTSCSGNIAFDSVRGFVLSDNCNGGIEGGMTNGMPLIVHFSMKPLPGGCRGSDSVCLKTGCACVPEFYRSDVEAVAAAALTAESLIAFLLVSAILETTGGCRADEILHRFAHFKARQKHLPENL